MYLLLIAASVLILCAIFRIQITVSMSVHSFKQLACSIYRFSLDLFLKGSAEMMMQCIGDPQLLSPIHLKGLVIDFPKFDHRFVLNMKLINQI